MISIDKVIQTMGKSPFKQEENFKKEVESACEWANLNGITAIDIVIKRIVGNLMVSHEIAAREQLSTTNEFFDSGISFTAKGKPKKHYVFH